MNHVGDTHTQGAGDRGPPPQQAARQHLLPEEGECGTLPNGWIAETRSAHIYIQFPPPIHLSQQKTGGIKFNATVPLTKVRKQAKRNPISYIDP